MRNRRDDLRVALIPPAIFLFALLSVAQAALAEVNPGETHGATDPNPVDQAEEELEPELEPGTEPSPDQPAQAPETKRKRRVFKRIGPQEVTPEQREEAERLRRIAAKYGTDPTAIVGRVQLTGQYQDLVQGARFTDTTLRVDLPFRKDFLFRVDMPFIKWSDPNQPGTTSAQGMSDLANLIGWRAHNTPEYAIFIGALSTFPTADSGTLGTGKYTTGPLFATARFLPTWDSLLFGILQHSWSVGGNSSRSDISLSRAAAQINSFWAERWWTIGQAIWQINWEKSAKSSMVVEFEAGRNIIGRWGLYVRPGVGIWGQSLPGAYQWNIETGIRYVFPSF